MDSVRNDVNTWLILQDLNKERNSEFQRSRLGVASLYNTGVSATGFMGGNPNDQIIYAKENHLFPEENEY